MLTVNQNDIENASHWLKSNRPDWKAFTLHYFLPTQSLIARRLHGKEKVNLTKEYKKIK